MVGTPRVPVAFHRQFYAARLRADRVGISI
jgi:hypothetical protein